MIIIFLLLFLSVDVQAATLWLSTTGTDTGNCQTEGSPCRTFDYAMATSRFNAGDTLTLKNGTYGSTAATGYPQRICGTNTNNGTSGNPWTLKAENWYGVKIINEIGSSIDNPLNIDSCNWFIIEGIIFQNVVTNTLGSSTGGYVGRIINSNDFIVRKSLFWKPNTAPSPGPADTNGGITTSNSNRGTFEQLEFYDIFRHALIFITGGTHKVDRVYCNSRGVGSGNSFNQRGNCVSAYPSASNIVENVFSIGQEGAFGVIASTASTNLNNSVYNSVSKSESIGFGVNQSTSSGTFANTTTFRNIVAISPLGWGTFFDSAVTTLLENGSFFGSVEHGIVFSESIATTSSGGTVRNTLAMSGSRYGAAILGADTFLIEYLRGYNNTDGPTTPTSHANIQNVTTSDPSMGSCYLWQPDGSNLLGTGKTGANIGARVLYLYQSGTETATRLWESNGALVGAGPTVSGINDTSSDSLIGIAAQFNINTGGCSFPSGYLTGGSGGGLATGGNISLGGNVSIR